MTVRVAVTLEQCWHRVPGGVAHAAIETARAIESALPNEVEQVGISALHATDPDPSWSPPIDVRPVPLPRLALYEAWHRLRWPGVDLASGQVDVIHATGMAIPPKSAPLLVTVQDLAFLRHPKAFTRWGLRFFRRSLALTKRDADLVMCPSRATADEVVAAGIAASRIRVVPYGVEQKHVTAEEVETVRRAWKLDRPYILSVGTIEPRKNVGGLLEACARLHRPDLDVVLVGPSGWNEDYERLVAPYRGQADVSRIRPLGFVPRNDLAALYAGAEVFCYPSFMEGFGLPVLEAMVQGTATVTSIGTSTEEVAGTAGVLVEPNDAASIASGLERALDDAASTEPKIGPACRRRAEEFTWDKTARLVAALYRELG